MWFSKNIEKEKEAIASIRGGDSKELYYGKRCHIGEIPKKSRTISEFLKKPSRTPPPIRSTQNEGYYCGYTYRKKRGKQIVMEGWERLDQIIECAKDYYYKMWDVTSVEVYLQPSSWETETGTIIYGGYVLFKQMRKRNVEQPTKLKYRISREGEFFY